MTIRSVATRLVNKFNHTRSEEGVSTAFFKAERYLRDRLGLTSNGQIQNRRNRLASDLNATMQATVAYGPFKGMRFHSDSWWSSSDRPSMIFGFYELEVLEALNDLSKSGRFQNFIDIGAADGYYGVGVLINGLFENAYCFEISAAGQKVIGKTAQLNGVAQRVTVFGKAEPHFHRNLEPELFSSSVVLVDIEGGEFELLNANVFRVFQKSAFIIEIHEWADPTGEKIENLRKDAAEFFTICDVRTSARDLSKYPELHHYIDNDRWLLCSESRGSLGRWFVLKPKT